MFGKETHHSKDTNSSAYIRSKFREFNRQRGVVIRACEEVFECLAARRKAAYELGRHCIFCRCSWLPLPQHLLLL